MLDFKELREFATLLKHYREDLQVEDFLKKLKDLYGEQREFLIPGKILVFDPFRVIFCIILLFIKSTDSLVFYYRFHLLYS